MTTQSVDLDSLSSALLRVLPRPNTEESRIADQIYCMLSRGTPIPPWRVAAHLHIPVARIEQVLSRWPGVHRNGEGYITAFWGLSTLPTAHRFEIGGRRLHTWCTWDGLFLPAVLRRRARIETRCPITGETLRLTVGPRGIRSVEPNGVVMSFITPDAAQVRENIVLHFCRFVHFFGTREHAERWTRENDGTMILSLDDAFELGRRKLVSQFGRSLPAARGT